MFMGRILRRTGWMATLASLALSVVAAEARELRVSVFEPPQGFYPVHILKP